MPRPIACPVCRHPYSATNPYTHTCSSAGLQGSRTPRCGCDHREESAR